MREENLDLTCFAIKDEWADRSIKENEGEYRSKFLRDRDRILYSKEFRRLSGKTQVFVVGFDDHFRTSVMYH